VAARKRFITSDGADNSIEPADPDVVHIPNMTPGWSMATRWPRMPVGTLLPASIWIPGVRVGCRLWIAWRIGWDGGTGTQTAGARTRVRSPRLCFPQQNVRPAARPACMRAPFSRPSGAFMAPATRFRKTPMTHQRGVPARSAASDHGGIARAYAYAAVESRWVPRRLRRRFHGGGFHGGAGRR